MKTTRRNTVIYKIKKLVGKKEHLFDTTIELTGSLNAKFTIDSVTSDDVFIIEGEDVNKTIPIRLFDVINVEDLELVLETLTDELSK